MGSVHPIPSAYFLFFKQSRYKSHKSDLELQLVFNELVILQSWTTICSMLQEWEHLLFQILAKTKNHLRKHRPINTSLPALPLDNSLKLFKAHAYSLCEKDPGTRRPLVLHTLVLDTSEHLGTHPTLHYYMYCMARRALDNITSSQKIPHPCTGGS